jgi:SAM-dependent methyltransferase
MKSMTDTKLRAFLRESYNRSAQERETSSMQAWKVEERANFLALLQREHKQNLLEIGSGPGRDSKFFQEQGLKTVCIDLSPAMVALCKQKGLEAYVMDMAEISFPEASFEAVYALNSLLHLPKVELSSCLQRIDRLLKTGGLFFLGIYGGYEHEGVWERDDYEPKRFFSFFSDEHIEQEVSKVFDVLAFKQIVVKPDDPIHFQSLILQKKDTAQSQGAQP